MEGAVRWLLWVDVVIVVRTVGVSLVKRRSIIRSPGSSRDSDEILDGIILMYEYE